MSEMVERVTEAICQAEREWLKSDRRISLQQATAIAAIKGMREPTEDMLKAAHIKMHGEAISPDSYWPGMAQRWRQMIDEALK